MNTFSKNGTFVCEHNLFLLQIVINFCSLERLAYFNMHNVMQPGYLDKVHKSGRYEAISLLDPELLTRHTAHN